MLQHYENLLLDQEDFDKYGGPKTRFEGLSQGRPMVQSTIQSKVSNFALENLDLVVKFPAELGREVTIVRRSFRYKIQRLNGLSTPDLLTRSFEGNVHPESDPSTLGLLDQESAAVGLQNASLSDTNASKTLVILGEMDVKLDRLLTEVRDIKGRLEGNHNGNSVSTAQEHKVSTVGQLEPSVEPPSTNKTTPSGYLNVSVLDTDNEENNISSTTAAAALNDIEDEHEKTSAEEPPRNLEDLEADLEEWESFEDLERSLSSILDSYGDVSKQSSDFEDDEGWIFEGRRSIS